MVLKWASRAGVLTFQGFLKHTALDPEISHTHTHTHTHTLHRGKDRGREEWEKRQWVPCGREQVQ